MQKIDQSRSCIDTNLIKNFSHAHNEILHEWIELGPVGPIALIIFFILPLIVASVAKFCRASIYILSMTAALWFLFGLVGAQMPRNTLSLLYIMLIFFGYAIGVSEKDQKLTQRLD